jgi:hypothetical protein
MFPTSVIRRLAPSEEMFAQSQTFVGATVQLNGPVDSAAMSAAFDVLLQAHPVLAGHLETGPDGLHHIVVDDFLHPGIWTGTTRMRLDQTAALGNVRLVIGDGHAEVTLYTHHSLADAQHQFRLLEELFSFYTDLVCNGDTGPVSVGAEGTRRAQATAVGTGTVDGRDVRLRAAAVAEKRRGWESHST